MAAEPSGATTMSSLMLRVAEKLGIAEYRSTGQLHIPVDQYNFNLCKRYINNGIRMFMADAPRKGWRWMRRICSVTFAARLAGTADVGTGVDNLTDATLTAKYPDNGDLDDWWIYILTGTGAGSYAQIDSYIGATGKCGVVAWIGDDPDTGSTYAITSTATTAGDTSRYNLPANFGGTVDGKIKYAANSNTGVRIEWCDEATIRARWAVSVNSGTPRLAAIRPYQPTDENLSATRLWEMIIDPQSIAADVVEFPYTLYFDSMKMESGIATSAAASYICDNTRSEADGYFFGWLLTVVDGPGVGETATVSIYTGASGEFKFTDGVLSGGTIPTTASQYIVTPPANLHPAGHQFDDVIESACLARTEMESQDEHMDTFWTDYYHKKALRNAFTVDQRSAPRTLGPMLNGPALPHGRDFNDVVYRK